MTDHPDYPDGLPPHDAAHGDELHGLIEPDRSQNAAWKEATQYVEALSAGMQQELERNEQGYFGEEGKPRSRRTRTYFHTWNIDTEGYKLTPTIAADAAHLAANCKFELMLSSASPELGPKFGPDLIAFNGRNDACEDFTYRRT